MPWPWRVWLCHVASISFHLVLFALGGILLSEAAQFGVEVGHDGLGPNLPNPLQVEVVVVVETEPTPENRAEPETRPISESAPAAIPEATPLLEPTPIPAPAVSASAIPPAHSGSAISKDSAKRRTSETVAKAPSSRPSAGSTGVQSARADYLRNPPPPYPMEAKRHKQEGVVHLLVVVNTAGRAESVTLAKSSGYPLLDDSAAKAVRGWKFHPAKAGGVKISSAVRVPVRFTLD